MKTLTNPFFEEMEKDARKAEKELGVNLTVKTGIAIREAEKTTGRHMPIIAMTANAM